MQPSCSIQFGLSLSFFLSILSITLIIWSLPSLWLQGTGGPEVVLESAFGGFGVSEKPEDVDVKKPGRAGKNQQKEKKEKKRDPKGKNSGKGTAVPGGTPAPGTPAVAPAAGVASLAIKQEKKDDGLAGENYAKYMKALDVVSILKGEVQPKGVIYQAKRCKATLTTKFMETEAGKLERKIEQCEAASQLVPSVSAKLPLEQVEASSVRSVDLLFCFVLCWRFCD